LGGAGLFLAKKFAKTEKAQSDILKLLALLLFISIVTNRLSQVFRYDDVRWYSIVPDSICGMTSLVLSLGVLFGKKDNGIVHFSWLLGLFGGISTVIYATFVGQHPTFFYLPTISGLIHHSLAAMVAVAVLMFGYIEISYKKWFWTVFGFTLYVTVGAFLMNLFHLEDAMHLAEPLLDGTPLTIWVMAPIYAVAYGIILAVAELVKKNSKKSRA
jgi:hypothetical protein